MPTTPTTKNKRAGAVIRQLREERGLSTRELSFAIYAAGLGSVDRKTIERIEAGRVTPRLRVKHALAGFFERNMHAIWPVDGAPPRTAPVWSPAPPELVALYGHRSPQNQEVSA